MNYKANTSIFIREEVIDNTPVYFIYVGDSNEMYKLNQSAYDCFSLCCKGLSENDVCIALSEKYSKTDFEQIQDIVQATVESLVANRILEIA